MVQRNRSLEIAFTIFSWADRWNSLARWLDCFDQRPRLLEFRFSARSVVELIGSPRIAARLLPMIARDCAIRPLPQAFTHHATLVWQGSTTAMKSNLVF